MNGRLAKKLRKIARKSDIAITIEFKNWVNHLGFKDKIKLCWKILRGKM